MTGDMGTTLSADVFEIFSSGSPCAQTNVLNRFAPYVSNSVSIPASSRLAKANRPNNRPMSTPSSYQEVTALRPNPSTDAAVLWWKPGFTRDMSIPLYTNALKCYAQRACALK